jgi:hypothetical protein
MTNLSTLKKQLKKHNLEVIIRCETKDSPTTGRLYNPNWNHLPPPSRDKFIKGPIYVKSYCDLPEDHNCGTINFRQYRQWFPKTIHKKAIEKGMRHTLLAVDSSLVSYYKKQCLFPRAKAVVIGTVREDNSIRTYKSLEKLLCQTIKV